MKNILSNYKLIFLGTCILFCCACASQKSINFKEDYSQSDIISDTSQLQQEARYFFINGVSEQVQQHDAEAILEFQEALRFDKHPSIYYSIAKSFTNLYKRERAIEYLKLALNIYPEHLPSLDLLSDIYYYIDIKASNEYNNQALALYETKERLIKSAILNETLDIEKSISLYKELIEKYNSDIELLYRLSDIYFDMEQYDSALIVLNKIDKLEPSNLDNIYKIVQIMLNSNDYQKALDYSMTKKMLLTSTEFESNIYNLGLFYYQLDSIDNKDLINQYLDLINDNFKLSYNMQLMGLFLSSKYSSKDLPLYVDRALKLSDSLDQTLSLSIQAYFLNNDTISCRNLITQYQEDIDKSPLLLSYVTSFYSMVGQDSIALLNIKKELKLDSNNADIYAQMGVIYDKIGLVEQSDSANIKALSINPNHLNANNNYAYSLAVRKIKLDEALKMAEKLINASEQHAAFIDTYAWVNYQLGKLDVALEYLQKAIEYNDASSEVYEHLGYVLMDKNNFVEAKYAFIKSLELNPNNKNSKEKLEILNNK
ncbi:MAG TPA: tetratricopeptide repeat protein [Candidatus Kapabacteria bacterium]|nr:tetratricopeptide repeat protein [Candidatus Kapabacteria bacterium]